MPFITVIFLVLIIIELHKSNVDGAVITFLIKILAPVFGFGTVAGSTNTAAPFVEISVGLLAGHDDDAYIKKMND